MDGRWITVAALAALGGAKMLASSGSRALPSGSPIALMGDEFRRQFPRWSDDAWESVVRGPGAKLARTLERSGAPKAEVRLLLLSWLELVGDALGRQMVSTDPQRDLFSSIWLDRIPVELGGVSSSDRPQVLADLFNASETAFKKGSWFTTILESEGSLSGVSLTDLSDRLLRFRGYDGPTLSPDRAELHWIRFGAEFLPGNLEFVSGYDGRLVLVTDRRSSRVEGIWLSRTHGPVRVGAFPSGRRRALRTPTESVWDDLALREPSITRRYHTVESSEADARWWSVASLVTSRFVVCAIPEGAAASGGSVVAAPASSFDLGRVEVELGDNPAYIVRPDVLSAAVVSDLCRQSGAVDPLTDGMWAGLGLSFPKRGARLVGPSSDQGEKLSLLSFFLDASPTLEAHTLAILGTKTHRGFLLDRMSRFLDSVAPIDARLAIGDRGSHRTEFLRKWVSVLDGGVKGQIAKVSRKLLADMDSMGMARTQANLFVPDRASRIRTLMRQTWETEKDLGPWQE